LAPLTDGDRGPSLVAAAMTIREVADENPTETIAKSIGDRRVLILLDNCEHVLTAAAALAHRLLAADGVRILATSREGLGLDGERLFALRSLGIPSPDAGRDAKLLRECDAVKLFVDRAQRSECAGDCRHLPPARRHPARDRACRGEASAGISSRIAR
jgi:predicted ATPase